MKDKQKLIGYWLLLGVFMIMVQVLLGGITRLTGSGLSIAEWKPILGAIPPLNDHDWQSAFDLYKQKASGQFIYLNSDFTLGDFKAIYFWEWMHREWARLMGVVFAAGFIYFLIKKYFNKKMILPLVILFALGALQGLVGWIMVQSGLNETDIRVSHIRLAVHFMAALLLLCYVLWFALQLLIPKEKFVIQPRLQRFTILIIVLFCLQLIYGAFMAGLRAASAASTWPTINGSWTIDDPSSFATNRYSGIHIFTDNPLMVQLVHRTIAYVLFFAVLSWVFRTVAESRKQKKPLLGKTAIWAGALVMLQVTLGIFTVLAAPKMTYVRFGSFEMLAEAHQLIAMFLLICLTTALFVIRRKAV